MPSARQIRAKQRFETGGLHCFKLGGCWNECEVVFEAKSPRRSFRCLTHQAGNVLWDMQHAPSVVWSLVFSSLVVNLIKHDELSRYMQEIIRSTLKDDVVMFR